MTTLGSRSEVAILMGTCDGEEYFAPQLDSIIAQAHSCWKLWVSDDSVSDSMLCILDAYGDRLKERLDVRVGPRRGFVTNFLSLVISKEVVGRYFAFADQDDVWDADKLARAVEWLDAQPDGEPALYCTRVRLVDEAGCNIGLSPFFGRPPSFRNALVQSLAGGNTMVFNEATRRLLVKAGADIDVVVHDWWIYLVVTGCGGNVQYDGRPSVSYRQHACNQIGGRHGLSGVMSRIRGVREQRMRGWIDLNLAALERLRDELTPEAREILERFCVYRTTGGLTRFLRFRATGAYRQHAFENIFLYLSAALGGI